SKAIQDLLGLEEGERLDHQIILGVITEMRFKKTKKGEKMALIQVEDMTGSMECLLFPDTLKSLEASIQTGSPMVINITVEYIEEGIRSTVNDIISIEEYLTSKARGMVLHIKEEELDLQLLNKMGDLIAVHKGEKPLFFAVYNGTKRTLLQVGKDFWIELTPGSIRDFSTLPRIDSLTILG
ncbi:MAG: hypothetical protein ACK4WB_07190, partial [Desulfatiglandales bacterium]